MQVWRKLPDMSHKEWLEWRSQGIGGSDAPAIMGVSPWSTPYQKWEEKVYGKKQKDNASKKFGRATEEASRFEFEDLIGKRMLPANVENVEFPWIKASLDGIDPKFETIVEIKKANKEDHALACHGIVPEKYFPQCQHIMLVTGKMYMFYFSSPAKGERGQILEVFRDSDYIAKELFPKLKEFWEMIQNKTPPKSVKSDTQCMDDCSEWDTISDQWKNGKQALEILEDKQDVLRKEIIRIANGNAVGNGVSLKCETVTGRIDYEAAFDEYISSLKEKYPDIHFPVLETERFRKESFTKWTLRAID